MTAHSCNTAQPLIPRYLDGELVEHDAGPLRRHLLSCQGCRTATQGEKAARRWFQAEAEVPVPQGFAARVARLAFAGVLPGEGSPVLLPPLDPQLVPMRPAARAVERSERILPFVLRLTAAAAVLLIVLSGFLRSVQVANSDDLRADNATVPTLEELDRMLEELDEQAAPTPALAPAEEDPAR